MKSSQLFSPLLIFFLLFFLTTCKKKEEVEQAPAQSIQTIQFTYPLKIGNVWTYSFTSYRNYFSDAYFYDYISALGLVKRIIKTKRLPLTSENGENTGEFAEITDSLILMEYNLK